MSIDLQNGQKFSWQGQKFEVFSQDNDHYTLVSERTQSTRQCSRAQLADAMQHHEITLLNTPLDASLQRHLSALNKPEFSDAIMRRRWYVDALMLEGKIGSRAIIADVISDVAKQTKDPNPPSITSVYNWARAFSDSDRHAESLLPRHKDKGNRIERFDSALMELFHRTMDEFYLSSNRPSAKAAHEWLGDLVIGANQQKARNRLRNMSYKAFSENIRRRVDPYWLIRRRHGAKAAKRKFRGTGDGIVTTYPLERVEIDHTILDVQVVNPRTGEIIGRPTLTWAMDHFSRVILGVVVSLESPSSHLLYQCLTQVLQDKTPRLHQFKNTEKFSWNLHGIPRGIVVDNGPEFHGHHFKAICKQYGIDIQYCPPGTPWFKGRVERFVRTLNDQLIHLMPGTTRSNSRDRGDYRSEDLACLTLAEVESHIWRYITTHYHESVHSILGCTPKQAWDEGIVDHAPTKIEDPRTLTIDLAKPIKCKLSSGRVQYLYLKYSSVALRTLNEQLKASQRDVILLIDPTDISSAWVENPLTKTLIEVPCVSHGVEKGMTLDEYLLLRKANTKSKVAPELRVAEAKQKLRVEIQQAHSRAEKMASKKKSRRTQLAKSVAHPNAARSEINSDLSKKEKQRITQFAESGLTTSSSARPRRNNDFEFTDDEIIVTKRLQEKQP